MPDVSMQSAVWLRSTEDEELLLRSLNRADRLDFENWQENDLEKCILVYYKSFEEVRKIYLEMKRLPCKHCSRCRKTASSPRSFFGVSFPAVQSRPFRISLSNAPRKLLCREPSPCTASSRTSCLWRFPDSFVHCVSAANFLLACLVLPRPLFSLPAWRFLDPFFHCRLSVPSTPFFIAGSPFPRPLLSLPALRSPRPHFSLPALRPSKLFRMPYYSSRSIVEEPLPQGVRKRKTRGHQHRKWTETI